MKKVLLILSCLLSGCFHKTFYDEPQPVAAHENNVVSIARMTTGNVNVVCEQRQQDSLGVPITCGIKNTTDSIQWVNAQLSIYSERDNKLVKSFNLFTDTIPAHSWCPSNLNLSDFQIQKECGFNLNKCVVLVENVNPWIPDYKP